MRKLIFIFVLTCSVFRVFAQSDSVPCNATKETTKLDALAQLTDNQKTKVLIILQDYYNHKEEIAKTIEQIARAKESLKSKLDLVRYEEQNFDEQLKYILTKHQYDNCSSYFKDRKEKINKANGVPKQSHKCKPRTNSKKGS